MDWVIIVYLFVCVHFVNSVRLTAAQRISMIHLANSHEELDGIGPNFNAHLWRVFFCVNPWKIYPACCDRIVRMLS